MCAHGTSIGETHLTNFNGLLYDFQASGDFLLAQAGSDFIVQTRQALTVTNPRWIKNATINKAVATQMGPTRVAVCLEPTRLIVNGKRNDLADGNTLPLASGVSVSRSGNVYVITRQGGETVRATLNNNNINSWIDVAVDLGHPPVAEVHGLLGNANGNTSEDGIATRNGTVLTEPVSFTDLYHSYADSWRVAAAELAALRGQEN